MVIRFRHAHAADREFCRSTHHLAYHDVVELQFGPWDEEQQDGFFDAKWSRGNLDILLVDEQECGFAVIADAADHVEVFELVIHPDWQGRGIGTEVLNSVTGRAANCGVPVRLKVLHRNRSVELYKRLGFIDRDRSQTHFELEWSALNGDDGR